MRNTQRRKEKEDEEEKKKKEKEKKEKEEKEKKEKEAKEKALANRGLPHCFYDLLKPIFDRLSDEKLLERCKDGYTQNQNESFNGMIWNHAPKHKFFGYRMIRAAVNMAAGYYNDGAASYAETMADMKIPPNYISLRAFHKMDKQRIEMAERRKKDTTKARRIELRRKKATRMETEKKREGTTYRAGGFGGDIDVEEPPPKKARTDSGSKQPAAAKGSKKPAAAKGSKQPAAAKGSKKPAAAKGSKQPAAAKGSKQPAAAKGSKQPAAAKGSKKPPAAKGSKQPAAAKGSKKAARGRATTSQVAPDEAVDEAGPSTAPTEASPAGTVGDSSVEVFEGLSLSTATDGDASSRASRLAVVPPLAVLGEEIEPSGRPKRAVRT